MSNTVDASPDKKNILIEMLKSKSNHALIRRYFNADMLIRIAATYAFEEGGAYIKKRFFKPKDVYYGIIVIRNGWDVYLRKTYENAMGWVMANLPTTIKRLYVDHIDDDIGTGFTPILGETITIEYQGIKILVTITKNEKDAYYPYITFQTENKYFPILKALVDTFMVHPDGHNMIPVYTYTIDSGWVITNYVRKRPVDTIVLADGITKNLIDRTVFWRDNKQWYHDHYIGWKQNNLLHGPAGTGKSTLVVVLATLLERGIAKLPIGQLTNTSLMTAVGTLPKNVIVSIEDSDTAKNMGKRKAYTDTDAAARITARPATINTEVVSTTSKGLEPTKATKDAPVSPNAETLSESLSKGDMFSGFSADLDTILNFLQGLDTPDGLFTVFTSNAPDFDHAVIREGRMDVICYVGYLEDKEIREYIHKKYPNARIPRGMKFNPLRGAALDDIATRTAMNEKAFVEAICERSHVSTLSNAS